jgi:hypothetical protein
MAARCPEPPRYSSRWISCLLRHAHDDSQQQREHAAWAVVGIILRGANAFGAARVIGLMYGFFKTISKSIWTIFGKARNSMFKHCRSRKIANYSRYCLILINLHIWICLEPNEYHYISHLVEKQLSINGFRIESFNIEWVMQLKMYSLFYVKLRK